MDEDYQKLLDYSLKLLSLRPRSVNEIKFKLKFYSGKKKLPVDLVEQVLKNLTENKLLNDEEFCRWWIRERQTFRPKGEKVIRMELLAKGIDRSIIDSTLASDQSKDSEVASAQKIISKKIKLYKNLPAVKLKKKLSEHLLRRGFDWDIIKSVIDSAVQKE